MLEVWHAARLPCGADLQRGHGTCYAAFSRCNRTSTASQAPKHAVAGYGMPNGWLHCATTIWRLRAYPFNPQTDPLAVGTQSRSRHAEAFKLTSTVFNLPRAGQWRAEMASDQVRNPRLATLGWSVGKDLVGPRQLSRMIWASALWPTAWPASAQSVLALVGRPLALRPPSHRAAATHAQYCLSAA